ncbi:hypothetical protein [Vibrio vulnificus]|uniref:Uncharacterized protein n=1 Tax=Vibrio vulnificus TaxID=672 RepID=A0A2S3QV77_VIBVL|nr:hypothetical protein [Vibrio vulnificus]EJV9310107.1 hypothetical protein [Vibrio vulnificus]ELP6756810.1 hypothetical protein [Vibrio vulnificus]MDK2619180.1 hypothetical protein [Vibrio vulnificus]POB41768.1 hypothetical protein CRN52_22515 [Vibrio vulnificus]RAH32443.1 hypothetical protein DOT36_00635 [Vibrio vulnificus]
MMKYYVALLSLFCSTAWGEISMPHDFPSGAKGILSVEKMTEGQFFWLRGRIGEGRYTRFDEFGRHCSYQIPVVAGAMADAGFSVNTVSGMFVIVMSQRLNDALLAGERISSAHWRFVVLPNELSSSEQVMDGYIVEGVLPDEHFILNSKRRWISWLAGDKRSEMCW